MSKRRPRIFIGLTEIADYYAPLHAGLEELGYDAVLVSLVPHPFYGMVCRGRVPFVARVAMAVARRDASPSGRFLLVRAWWWFAARLLRLPLLLWALATREMFIFGFASSFAGCLELPLLKLMRKRVVFIFHGSDSRPPYLNGAEPAARAGASADALVRATRRVKRRVRTIDRWADVIVDNPLSAHFHRRQIVSFLAIGIPRVAPVTERRTVDRDVVRVLHCPSHRAAKGSDELHDVIESLQRDDVPIELVELTDVPHEQVRQALREADVVVDQLYSDTALAGFAAEAAAAGLPVIVGGYGRQDIDVALCGRPFPPVAFCRPDELDETLKRLALDGELRCALGEGARAYVETELTPRLVAQRLLDAIGGERPEWTLDPGRITYVHGYGLSEAATKRLVRAAVDHGGVGALCVDDKPLLQERLLEFAGVVPRPAIAERPEGAPSS